MTEPRLARRSFGKDPYPCKKSWPADCFVQCGGDGVVFTSGSLGEALADEAKAAEVIVAALGGPSPDGAYRTAFFEAFPRDPSCYLRGEGRTIEEAEERAFAKFQRVLSCPGHAYERRGREDGYAYCRHCPHAGLLLEPLTVCTVCQAPTRQATDKDGRWYCEPHFYELDYDSDVKEKRRSAMISEDDARMNFVLGRARFRYLAKTGVTPASKEDRDAFHDALIRAEVWDEELGKLVEDCHHSRGLPSDTEIEELYRRRAPFLVAAVLAILK